MKSETGSLAVEAALVIPIILVVLVAVAELFMIAVTRLEMEAAARAGSGWVAATRAPSRAAAAVKSSLPAGVAEKVRVEVTGSQVVGHPVTVVVSMRYRPVTPFLDRLAILLRSRAVMQREG